MTQLDLYFDGSNIYVDGQQNVDTDDAGILQLVQDVRFYDLAIVNRPARPALDPAIPGHFNNAQEMLLGGPNAGYLFIDRGFAGGDELRNAYTAAPNANHNNWTAQEDLDIVFEATLIDNIVGYNTRVLANPLRLYPGRFDFGNAFALQAFLMLPNVVEYLKRIGLDGFRVGLLGPTEEGLLAYQEYPLGRYVEPGSPEGQKINNQKRAFSKVSRYLRVINPSLLDFDGFNRLLEKLHTYLIDDHGKYPTESGYQYFVGWIYIRIDWTFTNPETGAEVFTLKAGLHTHKQINVGTFHNHAVHILNELFGEAGYFSPLWALAFDGGLNLGIYTAELTGAAIDTGTLFVNEILEHIHSGLFLGQGTSGDGPETRAADLRKNISALIHLVNSDWRPPNPIGGDPIVFPDPEDYGSVQEFRAAVNALHVTLLIDYITPDSIRRYGAAYAVLDDILLDVFLSNYIQRILGDYQRTLRDQQSEIIAGATIADVYVDNFGFEAEEEMGSDSEYSNPGPLASISPTHSLQSLDDRTFTNTGPISLDDSIASHISQGEEPTYVGAPIEHRGDFVTTDTQWEEPTFDPGPTTTTTTTGGGTDYLQEINTFPDDGYARRLYDYVIGHYGLEDAEDQTLRRVAHVIYNLFTQWVDGVPPVIEYDLTRPDDPVLRQIETALQRYNITLTRPSTPLAHARHQRVGTPTAAIPSDTEFQMHHTIAQIEEDTPAYVFNTPFGAAMGSMTVFLALNTANPRTTQTQRTFNHRRRLQGQERIQQITAPLLPGQADFVPNTLPAPDDDSDTPSVSPQPISPPQSKSAGFIVFGQSSHLSLDSYQILMNHGQINLPMANAAEISYGYLTANKLDTVFPGWKQTYIAKEVTVSQAGMFLPVGSFEISVEIKDLWINVTPESIDLGRYHDANGPIDLYQYDLFFSVRRIVLHTSGMAELMKVKPDKKMIGKIRERRSYTVTAKFQTSHDSLLYIVPVAEFVRPVLPNPTAHEGRHYHQGTEERPTFGCEIKGNPSPTITLTVKKAKPVAQVTPRQF